MRGNCYGYKENTIKVKAEGTTRFFSSKNMVDYLRANGIIIGKNCRLHHPRIAYHIRHRLFDNEVKVNLQLFSSYEIMLDRTLT